MVSTVVLVHFTPSEPPTQRDDARPSFRPDRPDTKTLSAECEVDGSASSIPGTLEGGEAAGSAVAHALPIAQSADGEECSQPSVDTNEYCARWAVDGECERNPGKRPSCYSRGHRFRG
eukprot:3146567-Rhodomonas_salina.1